MRRTVAALLEVFFLIKVISFQCIKDTMYANTRPLHNKMHIAKELEKREQMQHTDAKSTLLEVLNGLLSRVDQVRTATHDGILPALRRRRRGSQEQVVATQRAGERGGGGSKPKQS